MDDEFYDLVYEAWQTGKDPDAVSIDAYDNCRTQGYYPDEISLNMVYPKQTNSS
jgi:hypothetical protein